MAWMSCSANERAAESIRSSSAATIRSKPFSANWTASSRPMPLEAPVTTASGRVCADSIGLSSTRRLRGYHRSAVFTGALKPGCCPPASR
jgi:hypothetical protein